MKDSLLVQLGEKIRAVRLSKGLSQEELAFQANVHRTYIGMVERGEKNVTIRSLKKICDALGVSLSMILGDLEGVSKLVSHEQRPSWNWQDLGNYGCLAQIP